MTQLLKDILAQSEALAPEEQLVLMARLAERNRHAAAANGGGLKWRDVRGLGRPSLLGEDAQSWISRSRSESDEHRGRAMGE